MRKMSNTRKNEYLIQCLQLQVLEGAWDEPQSSSSSLAWGILTDLPCSATFILLPSTSILILSSSSITMLPLTAGTKDPCHFQAVLELLILLRTRLEYLAGLSFPEFSSFLMLKCVVCANLMEAALSNQLRGVTASISTLFFLPVSLDPIWVAKAKFPKVGR